MVHQTRTPEGERKVAQMVRVEDYDAQANCWVVEPIWPAAEQPVRETPAGAPAAAKPAAKPRTRARRRKSRRRSG